MGKSHPVRAAASNNAEWCAAMWMSHGLAVEKENGVWFTRSAPPPFYPNAVVADPVREPAEQAAFIAELAHGTKPFAVKDSFAELALEPYGFRSLFRAHWLAYQIADGEAPATRWTRVQAPPELRHWVAAWSATNAAQDPVFMSALLDDGRVMVLARRDGEGQIVGGAVAFEAAGVLGITNCFGSQDGLDAALSFHSKERTVASFSGQQPQRASRAKGDRIGSLEVWAR